MTDNSNALTKGAHHIGLTIPDLQRTRQFFVETLGLEQIGEVPDYPAVFLTDGEIMITLWQAKNPETVRPFDRHNAVGLHHFALKVPGRDALEALHKTLEAVSDVDIEFAPEPLGGGPIYHMMCNIPGGVRVEFLAPAS